ncbi:MAG: tetratricopeptide repeat protein, partial [Planctomycetota bacterium]|nr:tetratricopeptide repeat protein [Planctomycetota bacterium]
MSEPPIPFDETDRQAAEIAVAERLLTFSGGSSSISIAICNSPALRDSIIANLRERFDIEVVSLPAGTADPFDYVCDQLKSTSPPALFITNLEASVPSTKECQPALHAINAARELWRERFECPIVFWLPEFIAPLLAFHAPDLWSWLSHRFEFVSQFAHPMEAVREAGNEHSSMAGNLDEEKKRFRIAELEQRIDEAAVLGKKELTPHVISWNLELGNIFESLGELDKSESQFRKILQQTDLMHEIPIAAAYGNLGLIYRTRGDFGRAEEMHRKSLEIFERLGQQEGMAGQYGNLGLIYRTRGNLGWAEEMHRKALEINERLGQQGGVATQYGNLGLICKMRGDLDRAE